MADRRTHERIRRTSRRTAGWATLVLLLVAVAGLLAGTALAASQYIDLTTVDASVDFDAGANGGVGTALYRQGGSGAGTGTFDPFLTLSTNDPTEKGYNTTAANGEFDTFFGGGRTHPLRAAAIPPVTIGGIVYREFSLDANDQGSDDYMSIDSIKIFLDDQNDLTGFVKATNSFTSDNATKAYRIYDQGDGIVLMRSQALTPGSGVSDITIFVPDALFPAECHYGSLTCGKWVYFYTEMGYLGGTEEGVVAGTQNWDVTAGFEEWRTRLLPVVNVAKTVTLTRTRTFDWDITKQVSVDGGTTWLDSATVDLFNGASQDYLWRIVYTKDAGTLSAPHISGTITITNPTGGTVIGTAIDAVINSVTDVFPAGTTPSSVVASCGVSFPYTLKAGQTLSCTYSADPTATADGTNTANVVVENGANDLTYGGTAAVAWASATETLADNSATIADPNYSGFGQTVTAGGSSTSTTQTFTCGSDTTRTNAVTLTESTSSQERSDSASIEFNCYGLTVDKTVSTALTRSYDWTIVKEVSTDGGTTWVDAASVDLFNGQSQSYLWRITYTKSAGTDSAWAVSGTITITNPAPIAASGVSVSDTLSSSGAATVDCGSGSTTVNIAASSFATCSYGKSLSSAATQTNTASATLAGQTYSTAVKTVSLSSAAVTLVDNSATITDPNYGGFGQTVTASGSSTSTTQTFTCGADTTITNTATITEGTSSASHSDTASLTVDCHGLTVDKTVNTALTRTWTWSIAKTSTAPTALTLNPGETYASYPYTVTVNATSADSAWAVSGTITITNDSPNAASGVSVSDLLSSSGAATVDCGSGSTTVNVPANGSATCTYSKSVSSGAGQTNTASVTYAGQTYSSSAKTVGFSSATVTKVDDCVTITDPVVGTVGNVCAGVDTLPKSFTYNVNIGPYTSASCGSHTITNTATFTTDDTATTGTSSWTITVTVPCANGCTLTQGYWKTHSAHGPAPVDPNWTAGATSTSSPYDSGFGPDSLFYGQSRSYYQVLWNAPKGGDAYYILAHQYIAALLNMRAGAASTADVDAAMTYANTFFSTHSPTSNLSKSVRQEAIAFAGTLGAYNEGSIGPGHCSEDSIAQVANQQ